MTERFGVYLLEWLPALRGMINNGLDEYASAISECAATVSSRIRGAKPFMIGHSLGGTLATIASALAPDSIQALVLLGTPLCFEPGRSRFRDTLVSLVPPTLSEGPPVPGSLPSQVSVLASPATFIWSRLADAAFSATDRYAMDIHARVERWALDEASLPGKLVHETVEWLYRENRLCRGTLEVCNVRVQELTFEIPDDVAERLNWYRQNILPRLKADPNGFLFVTEAGTHKSQETLSQQITEVIAEHVGIHMTPHQFRHFGGNAYLDANPEDFETARAMLGHASAKTTRIYTGSSSRRASRAYGKRLLEQRDQLRLKIKRRIKRAGSGGASTPCAS